MANKLIKRNYNKLLSGRNNYFSLGSFMNNLAGNPNEQGVLTSGAFKGMNQAGVAGLKAAGTAVGTIGGNAISGGLTSGAGNVLQGLSGIASAIPGPWGAVASAGLGLAGGLFNRMFGAKFNDQNIAKVEGTINEMKNFQSNASDFDSLADNWSNANMGMSFNKGFIGKDGWFSNKVGKKFNQLQLDQSNALAWVNNALQNNAQNITRENMNNMLGSYLAYGGHLYGGGGGLYDLINRPFRAIGSGIKRAIDDVVSPTTEEDILKKEFIEAEGNKEAALKAKFIRDSKNKKNHRENKGGTFGGGNTGGGGASSSPSTTTRWEEVADTNIVPIPLMESFNDAFERARERKDSVFMFDGKPYNTRLGGGEGTYEAGERRKQMIGVIPDTLISTRRVPITENSWALGGPLMTHGSMFDTGLTYVGNGGTHEENPYEGVPMGMDQEGTPNLVEEGETVFNDYVFSKRLDVPDKVKKMLGLRGKRLTFADASLQLSKESEERPNDPISKAGFQDSMNKLMTFQEAYKQMEQTRQFAYGGNLFGGGGDTHTAGLRHNNNILKEDDPLYPIYKDYLDEEGKIDFNKLYAENSDWKKKRDAIYELLKDPEKSKAFREWYARNLNEYNKDREGWKDYTADEIDNAVFDKWSSDYLLGFGHNVTDYLSPLDLSTLVDNGPYEPVGEVSEPDKLSIDDLIKLPKLEETDLVTDKKKRAPGEYPNYDNWMRYMPVLGSTIGLGLTASSKPDYSIANALLEASKGKGVYQPVSFNTIGDYLTYRPADRDYYLNKLNEQAGATRRSLLNTAGLNAGIARAGLLAAGYNAQNSVGDTLMKMDQYNRDHELKYGEFNRGTNQYNHTGIFEADKANQDALIKNRELSLKGLGEYASLKYKMQNDKENAIAANMSNLFTSIGNIGKEKIDRQWRTWYAKNGMPPTKGDNSAAYGGKLKKKNRRKGFTY